MRHVNPVGESAVKYHREDKEAEAMCRCVREIAVDC